MIPISNLRNQMPKGLRLHIGFFGRRNAGKSSLINAITGQAISIVSNVAGTTTDPMEKPYELSPLGPILFIDTAGIDDKGDLGQLRVKRTLSILPWVDIALIVCASERLQDDEINLINIARQKKTPFIVVFNKTDCVTPTPETLQTLKKEGISYVLSSTTLNEGIDAIRHAIVALAKENTEAEEPMIGNLVHPGDTVLLVTPIDTGAPKGRLIMPQVQAIREVLDADALCHVVRENRLKEALTNLKTPPRFIVADSQVIARVCAEVPPTIPVTTFSIQMAGCKTDLEQMARGAATLSRLKPGDKILVCETCSHHPQADDIGREKIPRWIAEKAGGPLQVDVAVGKDFPEDLKRYKLILQCGGCVVTRRHMLARLSAAIEQGVPMTNYGLAISVLQGVIERVLAIHPKALKAYLDALHYGA